MTAPAPGGRRRCEATSGPPIGLVLADAQAALFTDFEREIQRDDRVLWAERHDHGTFFAGSGTKHAGNVHDPCS